MMPITEVQDEEEGKDQTLNALATGCVSSRWSDAVSIATIWFLGSIVAMESFFFFFFPQ